MLLLVGALRQPFEEHSLAPTDTVMVKLDTRATACVSTIPALAWVGTEPDTFHSYTKR